MTTDKYIFTREQLIKLMYGTIEMLQEYRDKHGKPEDEAESHAVREMLEGLDAERELFEIGEVPYPTLQIMEAV